MRKDDLFQPTSTISASEINRFTYCPYQWYYERLYGRKELRRLAKERNQALGLTDTDLSPLKKGLEYHDQVYQSRKRSGSVVGFGFFVLLLLVALIVVRMRYFV